MWSLPEWISPTLIIIGLVMTMLGAAVAARSVLITEEQANAISATKWRMNAHHRDNLVAQSRSARHGLWTVALGTLLQIMGTSVPLIQ